MFDFYKVLYVFDTLAGKDGEICNKKITQQNMLFPKITYTTPTVNVVELKSEGILCFSDPSTSIMWFYDGSSLSSDQEWGRNGYGNAEVI